eukprot:TRINITY_DN44326_c0_g1_i1.p1 TRINITY_DN44326_c0_g1~~TRINITY_DN44326_c0_g1_i1.p1  ORF type:complete len:262 (-),score=39.02 TRINITY_DN44326_c0_g1_i1:103-888(-)
MNDGASDAIALADALVASEVALAAALRDRDYLAQSLDEKCFDDNRSSGSLGRGECHQPSPVVRELRHELSQVTAEDIARVPARRSAWSDEQLSEQYAIKRESAARNTELWEQVAHLEECRRSDRSLIASLESENNSLTLGIAERDAALASLSHSSESEIEQLTQRLASAWEANRVQASEFVTSLRAVKSRVLNSSGCENGSNAQSCPIISPAVPVRRSVGSNSALSSGQQTAASGAGGGGVGVRVSGVVGSGIGRGSGDKA